MDRDPAWKAELKLKYFYLVWSDEQCENGFRWAEGVIADFENKIRSISGGALLDEAKETDAAPHLNKIYERALQEINRAEGSKAREAGLKPFLLSERGLPSLRQGLASSEKECPLKLFDCCTRALDAWDAKDDSEGVKFLDYAGEFWVRHAQMADALLDATGEAPYQLLRKCNLNSGKVQRILGFLMERIRSSMGTEWCLVRDYADTILVVLAAFGCTTLLKQHLVTCRDCQQACETKSDRLAAALASSLMGRWVATAQYLIDKYCRGNVNTLRHNNITLLYTVCYHVTENPDKMAKFLLDKGADAAAPSLSPHECPLHVAITYGNSSLVELLLADEKKAHELLRLQRKAGQHKGWTALHTAVGNRLATLQQRKDILQAILRAAPRSGLADLLEIKDGQGNTPGELAEIVCKDAASLHDLLEEFDNGRRPGSACVLM